MNEETLKGNLKAAKWSNGSNIQNWKSIRNTSSKSTEACGKV